MTGHKSTETVVESKDEFTSILLLPDKYMSEYVARNMLFVRGFGELKQQATVGLSVVTMVSNNNYTMNPI